MTNNKSLILDSILKELGSFIVAFSGGVDSSFLLHRAHKINKSAVMAVTVRTPYIPKHEIREAVEFTETHGIRHKILDIPFPELIRNNPVERCYLCKKTLFSELLSFAGSNSFRHIVDGSNADDTKTWRPGLKALTEMGVRSPLLEAGLTKNDIRELSKSEGLDCWDRPAMACLLTRIPYDTRITEGMLSMVEQAEAMFFEVGYPGTRVRIHGDMARIECLPGFMEKMVHSPQRESIIGNLKKIGFRYVSLDLEGYRTGSADPVNTDEPEQKK